MTTDEWIKLADGIAKGWPRDPLAPATVKAWYAGLSDLEAGYVAQALGELLREQQRMPSLSLIRMRAVMCRNHAEKKKPDEPGGFISFQEYVARGMPGDHGVPMEKALQVMGKTFGRMGLPLR